MDKQINGGNENVITEEKVVDTTKKETPPEIKAEFDIQCLIGTCGEEEIIDRVNKIDELLTKYPDLKKNPDILEVLDDSLKKIAKKVGAGVEKY